MADPNLDREVQRALTISRAFHKLADGLMDHAHRQLDAQQITLDQYYTVADRCEKLVQQANQVTYEVARLVGKGLDQQLAQIEQLSTKVQQSFARLQRIDRIIDLSMTIAVAVGSVVLAVLNPGVGTLGGAAAALADAGREVDRQTTPSPG